MRKFIRFDADQFGYVLDVRLSDVACARMKEAFAAGYPGKRLIIIEADEFIDLTGHYAPVVSAALGA